ncbi:MAG TPA: hypothetical protein VGI17_15860 [Solirubrobacterales bacterium]|jgi:hypothetical protein
MPDLLDREAAKAGANRLPLVAQRATKDNGFDLDEGLARVELRRQIGKLDLELGRLVAEGFGRVDVPHRVDAAGPPRVLGLGELEEIRDALATRIAEAHRALAERAGVEAANRELLAQMLLAPEEHRWLRISRADVGEPGCGHWHSRPVLGPIGMLMGWWRVKVSSGCPTGGRLAAAPLTSPARTSARRRPGAKRRSPSWRSSAGSSASRSA